MISSPNPGVAVRHRKKGFDLGSSEEVNQSSGLRSSAPGAGMLKLSTYLGHTDPVHTYEVKASHLSLISHPEEITRLILKATGQQT